MNMTEKPDLTLYISSGCPHCQTMLNHLSGLIKEGVLSRLEVINIAVAPADSVDAGIRSVPVVRVGIFELTGLHSLGELTQWIEKSASEQGIRDYINQEFEQGNLDKMQNLAEKQESIPELMLNMALNQETPITSRIGISAVFEHFAGSRMLRDLIPVLCRAATDEHASIRADAAYILGLSQHTDARPCLEKLLDDEFADVRETAHEALEQLPSIAD